MSTLRAPTETAIERLGLESLEEILAIEQASYAKPWSRESFLSELSRLPYSRIWGVRIEGALAAFAVVWVIAGEGHLANLATAPAERRRGLARLLVQGALDDARRRLAEFMLLEVRASNFAAIRLYEEFGFGETGRRRAYYEDGEDAVLMRLAFNSGGA